MLLRAALVPPEEAVAELWVATQAVRTVPGVAVVPPGHLDIPITSFGNLLPPDCVRLARKLRDAFGGATAPVVWFQGIRTEEATVVLEVAGDTEPLADLARYVPEAAETLRLYVDRRRFSTQVRLATVAPSTSASVLEAAVAPLADWTGSPWAVPGLSLIRTRWSQGEGQPEEYDLIALS